MQQTSLDWVGQTCAIIASGPSAKKAGVHLLQGKMRCIAIKENVNLAPWADVVYGCDRWWWEWRKGLPEYKGIKIAYDRTLAGKYPDIQFIDIVKTADRLVLDSPGVTGSGGNSGFQALNIAVSAGVKRIILIGFDMTDRSGVHWYGRNRAHGSNNPTEDNFRRWRAAFKNASAQLHELGIEVSNASQDSVLTCFKKQSVEACINTLAYGSVSIPEKRQHSL